MKGPRGNNAESSSVPLRRALLAALVLSLGFPVIASADNGTKLHCTGKQLRAVPESIAGVGGYYATPAGQPVGLVVFFHGYGHTAKEWADTHLERVAQRHHVIALAMDYPVPDGVAHPEYYTWQVAEGAEASNTVAQALNQQCAGLDTVVSYGVSMGGNASGLALATAPEGFYDWWFDIEGANNVVETYQEARAVAVSGNGTAVGAVRGIELEMGGTFEAKSDEYFAHANVHRVKDIVGSGIQGVVMVHALDDGLVPYNQSREMQAALLAYGTPVQFWTVGTCTSVCDDDTTIDGYASDVPHDNVLAGHSGELDYFSLVGNTGFERLDALFAGIAPTDSGEFVRDGDTGVYTKP
jgi:hypothetical protein